MSSEKTFKNPLYKQLELPGNVLNDDVHDRGSPTTVEEFASNTIPISEGVHVENDLRKTNIGLRLKACIMKRARPRARKVGLSQKERRIVGLFRLPRLSITYDEALPMNKLWLSYMHKFLNFDCLRENEWYNPKSGNLWDQVSTTLMKADYHGAHLKVASSLCNSLIGLEGIVVIDTKFTFQIVGKDDVCRTIPKESCIFDVFFKNFKFRIFGKYFSIRSSERSTKKIKCLFIPAL